jgi:hypothetical protein
MNVETTELTTIEQATKFDDSEDILALSADDLDLIGGGTQAGVVF